MRTALRPAAFAALTCLMAGAALAAPVNETRTVAPFAAIDASGPYLLTVHTHSAQALNVSGDAVDVADVETFVRGDTLVIRPRPRKGFQIHFGLNRPTVKIEVSAAALGVARIATSGATAIDQVAGERFELKADGAGPLRVLGNTRKLVLAGRGSGEVDLKQFKSTSAELTLNGSGDVAVGTIAGGELQLDLNGPGDLRIDTLDVNKTRAQLRGPGNARVTGRSAALRLEVNGPGNFEGCALAAQNLSALLRGPGDACVGGRIQQFEAESLGAGNLKVTGLDAASARVLMHGPGNVELQGRTAQLNAELHGAGNLDASALTATNAAVRSYGPGNARLASVSDTLDGDLRGAGNLSAAINGKRLMLKVAGPGGATIDGNVESLNAELFGPGDLAGRKLMAAQADVSVRGPGSAQVIVKNGGAGRLTTFDRSGRHAE